MIKRIIDYKITKEYEGMKISEYLHLKKYPENALKKLRHQEGSIILNGDIVHMNHRFSFDGTVEENNLSIAIIEDAQSEKIPAIKHKFEIVYEDEDIILVNKPMRMPIHPSLNNYENSLANALAFYFAEKGEPFIFRCINRLDRDTTGLTIVAKHYLAAGILADEMKHREIKRVYYGITKGAGLPSEGRIEMPIARKEASTIEREVNFENGEAAITNFSVLSTAKKEISLVKFELETGRTHQIRVHMKALGFPLIGDFLYNPDDKTMSRQALHAGEISFTHPVSGEYMSFKVDLPMDMQEILME